MHDNPEQQRLMEHHRRLANWRNWGPYVSERAWATVREDYSEDGEAWGHFTHEQARSRTYSCLHMNGISAMSTRQFLPGLLGESTKSIAKKQEKPTAIFLKGFIINFYSTSPGGSIVKISSDIMSFRVVF